MSDSVEFGSGLHVNTGLDRDGELELCTEDCSCVWLDRGYILALIAHLSKVLDDADEKQETER